MHHRWMFRLLQTVVPVLICLSTGVETSAIETLKEIWRLRQALLTCTDKLNYGCRCDPATVGICNFFCIPLDKRCNGVVDCPLGDDETDCPPKPCDKGEVCCQSGECASVCDGDMECENGADENFCEPPAPSECPGEMQCPSGQCATICDGDVECNEREDCEEDEKDCRFVCPDRNVVCDANGECGRVCAESAECPDGRDESTCYIECEEDEVSCRLEGSTFQLGCAELCEGTECQDNWDEADEYCGECMFCEPAVLTCEKAQSC